MSEIQAVLFDYGMVLSAAPDPAAWEEMKRLLDNASEERFHEVYWAFRDDYDRGHLSGETYWQSVADKLAVAAPIPQLLTADTALWTRPNQPMIDWAKSLQIAGYKTGILSNIGDAMEEGILAHGPWLNDFTHHTFSHRLKTAKPDPSIYHYAAEGLKTAPEAILFVDDRVENIDAARSVGMKAFQYLGHDRFLREMREAGFSSLL